MLDLLLLRSKEEGLNLLYESQKKRFKSTEIIDICVDLDARWKESKFLLIRRKTKGRYSWNGL